MTNKEIMERSDMTDDKTFFCTKFERNKGASKCVNQCNRCKKLQNT